MLFVKLSFVIFDNFCLFYFFLNIFANIDIKEIFFNKIFKTLIKIATIYVFINFSIKKAKFLIRIKVRFWKETSILILRFRTTNFAFNLYSNLINFKQCLFFLQFLKNYIDIKRILSIKNILSCDVFQRQKN